MARRTSYSFLFLFFGGAPPKNKNKNKKTIRVAAAFVKHATPTGFIARSAATMGWLATDFFVSKFHNASGWPRGSAKRSFHHARSDENVADCFHPKNRLVEIESAVNLDDGLLSKLCCQFGS